MAGHAQRDCADQRRADGCEPQSDKQCQPRRQAQAYRQVGTGIGTNAHESSLPERGQAAHAGEQDQTQHRQHVDADVIELDDPKIGQRQKRQ